MVQTILAVMIALGFGAAGDPGPTSQPSAAQTAHDRDDAAKKKLNLPLAAINFENTPFGDAINELRDKSSLPIRVDWKALQEIGVDRKTAITLHIPELRASTVLDLLLMVAGADHGKLAYAVESGFITISTAQNLTDEIAEQSYDIRRSLEGLDVAARQKKVGALTQLLTDHIEPSSWKSHGGSIGTIREEKGRLIITQTAENQRLIESILKNLGVISEPGPGR